MKIVSNSFIFYYGRRGSTNRIIIFHNLLFIVYVQQKYAMVTGEIRVTTRISIGVMVTKAKSEYVLSNSNN
jgi:hypothetical protein